MGFEKRKPPILVTQRHTLKKKSLDNNDLPNWETANPCVCAPNVDHHGIR